MAAVKPRAEPEAPRRKPERTTLTDLGIERKRPPASGRVEIWDKLTPGFAVRISSSGHRSWWVKYRTDGRQHMFCLGSLIDIPTVDEARDAARKHLRNAKQGINPLAIRRAPPPPPPPPRLTVQKLTDDFVTWYEKARGKPWGGKGRLVSHVLASWGNRAAADITKKDVHSLLDGLITTGGLNQGANRVRASLHTLFAWAAEREFVPSNPVGGVKAPLPEVKGDRVLDDKELVTIWGAAESLGIAARGIIRLLILTAQRRTEVASMRWSDIDFDYKLRIKQDGEERLISCPLWVLEAADTKANRRHEVPLSPSAVTVLKSLPRLGDYCFTTNGKTPISGFSKIKIKLDEKVAELATAEAKKSGSGRAELIAPWTLHDLRRSAATGMGALDVPQYVISEVLNHASQGVTARYNRHQYLGQKREALDMLAQHIESIIKAKAAKSSNLLDTAVGNVVKFRR